ncbi:sorbosone dehydrogenase family protein [Rhizobium sp. SEMIA 4085]|uniref:Glucose/sorbosone dehydrogenase protein n=1 Tax=Rhizobium gallicum bv. gallicum R602sp TaxID=1041138 RepID=A0A0B4XC71_9HYPH|nr:MULTISPECIES: sorbosone dehydrogenase family protein [Rhizobium]AJD44188.1 glucose/sorbosone dehydrogenase protein [Rhizobium gallicum bv. gallicum R602sp]NNH31399.1 sorbosone dehydrogenase family protein [Rhizobium sp. SEMIA 4085]
MKYATAAVGAIALATVLISSTTWAQDVRSSSPISSTASADWSMEVVAEGLDYPWEIQQTGGRILITEAAGDVVSIEGGRVVRHLVETSDPIAREGGGGLLGMTLSKDFESNETAYFYHTYHADGALSNKLIEARFDGTSWTETRTLLQGIPGHHLYNGGRVAIGPDGYLYVTTGWTENRQRPQDISSLAGKILRMTVDGKVPDDNPFPGSYVYSLGHRNPQGIAWGPDGRLFVAEHGQSAHDEINLIVAGRNYGWPVVSGDEERQGMERPLLHSGNNTWAPSGIAFAGNELLVSALVGKGLYVFDAAENSLKPIFTSGDRLRDVLPIGQNIYVVTTNRSPRAEGPSEDRLLKLTRTK